MPTEDTSPVLSGVSGAQSTSSERGELSGGRLLASAALIGAGVLIEPELLGGALLGAGVLYGLPIVGQVLRPVASTAVQLGYSAVASFSHLLVGARDEVQGIVASARSGYRRSHDSSIIAGR